MVLASVALGQSPRSHPRVTHATGTSTRRPSRRVEATRRMCDSESVVSSAASRTDTHSRSATSPSALEACDVCRQLALGHPR